MPKHRIIKASASRAMSGQLRLQSFYFQRVGPTVPWRRRLGERASWCGRCGEEKIAALAGNCNPVVQPVESLFVIRITHFLYTFELF